MNANGYVQSVHGAAGPSTADAGRSPRSTGPSWTRAAVVLGAVVIGIWWLGRPAETGRDEMVGKLGRIEVTARLLGCPESFPSLGAYRYTYVL